MEVTDFLESEEALRANFILTRAQRKQQRRLERKCNKNKKAENNTQKRVMTLKKISPLTEAQADVFQSFEEGQNLLLHGVAGTGKTFLVSYLALREILENQTYSHFKIIRSIVPGRDIGFLPGTAKEKAKVFETPYISNVNDLFGRGDAYEVLCQKNVIQFETTSFLRGETFKDTIVLVDEFQNCNYQELSTIITRCGKNTRIVFAGDYSQTDLQWMKERQGSLDFMNILHEMNSFDTIEFGVDDIVRSGLVKEFLIEKLKFEKNVRDERIPTERDYKVF